MSADCYKTSANSDYIFESQRIKLVIQCPQFCYKTSANSDYIFESQRIKLVIQCPQIVIKRLQTAIIYLYSFSNSSSVFIIIQCLIHVQFFLLIYLIIIGDNSSLFGTKNLRWRPPFFSKTSKYRLCLSGIVNR